MAPKKKPSAQPDRPERRVDPEDGRTYSFDEFAGIYAGKYKKSAIEAYWKEWCKPESEAKAKAKGKAKAKPQPKTKAEAKAKAKANKSEDRDKGTAEEDAAALAPERRKPLTPEEAMARIERCKVVPVVTVKEATHAAGLCKALADGGVAVAEIAFRTACALEAIREVSSKVPETLVGAGTVLRPDQVDSAIEAGADFMVSPGLDTLVARRCRQRGCLYLPGVVTPSEVMAAVRLGLKNLKFFPAACFGGTGTLKNYAPVFPEVRFMPTGGISTANMTDFLALPNVYAVGGGWLAAEAAITEAVASGQWEKITAGAKEAAAEAAVLT
jgi:2-dehydro-3-deoxyphosphogluconate aldolase/(4S)-4-hydroxy-2-oxoglutarate aldolase